ncbi:MAG: hypothetical protein QNJ55_05035 [Xenococcus sp. MO_188.B8]|nr:hypothetical protein [Xenococcus sp. MO_188.B8]
MISFILKSPYRLFPLTNPNLILYEVHRIPRKQIVSDRHNESNSLDAHVEEVTLQGWFLKHLGTNYEFSKI